jgi:hypothetical protein
MTDQFKVLRDYAGFSGFCCEVDHPLSVEGALALVAAAVKEHPEPIIDWVRGQMGVDALAYNMRLVPGLMKKRGIAPADFLLDEDFKLGELFVPEGWSIEDDGTSPWSNPDEISYRFLAGEMSATVEQADSLVTISMNLD